MKNQWDKAKEMAMEVATKGEPVEVTMPEVKDEKCKMCMMAKMEEMMSKIK